MGEWGTAVIRAFYNLEGDRDPVTAGDIAHHLDLDEKVVLAELRELKEKRIFRDHRRGGERVWERWE